MKILRKFEEIFKKLLTFRLNLPKKWQNFKLFAKNFQKNGKIFQKIIKKDHCKMKKYTFFAKIIKKIAKLAKNFGYCTKNTFLNIFFTSVRYFLAHFAEVFFDQIFQKNGKFLNFFCQNFGKVKN